MSGHVDQAPKYMADDYMEHDPAISGGRAGFVEHYSNASARPPMSKPVEAFAKGDYVVLGVGRSDHDPKTSTPYKYFMYDVARVKSGKIQEHWDNVKTDMPARSGPPPAAVQLGHGDTPPGVPMKNTYDVSSLKYTPEEQKNIDTAVGYYRDCVQSHHPELVDNFLAKNEINTQPQRPENAARGSWRCSAAASPSPSRCTRSLIPFPISCSPRAIWFYSCTTRRKKVPAERPIQSTASKWCASRTARLRSTGTSRIAGSIRRIGNSTGALKPVAKTVQLPRILWHAPPTSIPLLLQYF